MTSGQIARFASLLVSISTGVMAGGCGARRVQTLNQPALRAGQPHTLMVADHQSPPMSAEGRAKEGFEPAYMYGLMGGIAVAAKAETANRKRVHWMKGCEPEDPADQMRETVGEALGKAFALEVREAERTTRAKTLEEVIKVYPGVD